MSILEANGAVACAECGRQARAVCDRLKAENESLRELVRDFAGELRGLGVDFARVGWCDYADRMRGLGVEP